MDRMSRNQLVTIEDIEKLKWELLGEIGRMISEQKQQPMKKWLKSAEVRELLGFSPGKLQMIRESGLISYTKIGGNIYYDPEDLQKLFNENKRNQKDIK